MNVLSQLSRYQIDEISGCAYFIITADKVPDEWIVAHLEVWNPNTDLIELRYAYNYIPLDGGLFLYYFDSHTNGDLVLAGQADVIIDHDFYLEDLDCNYGGWMNSVHDAVTFFGGALASIVIIGILINVVAVTFFPNFHLKAI